MKTNLASSLQSIANTNDIRDIKPPVEIPNEWLWLWITLAAVFIIALAVTAWLLLRKKLALPPPIPVVPPHVRAKQKLAEALAFLSDPNRFCTVVADTTRVYLEERFNLRAPERTTEEFLVELRTSPHLTLDQKQSLGAFLESCDLVKFARFEPTETTLRQLHDAALRLVDETQFLELSALAPTTTFSTSPSSKRADTPAKIHVEAPATPTGQPFSLKDRLIGFGLAVGFIIFGLAMWIWPHLHLVPDGVDPSGRGGNRLAGALRLIEWLWSRPLGTLLAVVGLIVLWGVLTRKNRNQDA